MSDEESEQNDSEDEENEEGLYIVSFLICK